MDKEKAFRTCLDAIGDNEAVALEVMAAVAHKFGWAGPLYTRLDVERLWDELYPDKEFTDQHWEQVRKHPRWRRLHQMMTEEGWNLLAEIINDIAHAI